MPNHTLSKALEIAADQCSPDVVTRMVSDTSVDNFYSDLTLTL